MWVHQLELDRRLADGADPASDPALQARALQLQAVRCRHHLALQIDEAVAKAEHPPHWHSVRVPVRASEVRAAEPELRSLRQALTAPHAGCVPGLALAAVLLNDPDGPLYHACGGGEVARLAAKATRALAATAVGSTRR